MAGVFRVEHNHQLSTIALMQFCGADANVYVNYVSSIMFKDFQLSLKGQRSIALCLSNLPYVETADDRLTLGFGPDNIIRQPIVHQYGYEHLTVMVALASVFHEPYAAEVCHAYAASMAVDDDMLPHLRQWKNQLKTACGCLNAAGFSQLAENYIRLDPYSIGPGSNLVAKRCRVEPKDMAAGLAALSKITGKKEKQVTLVGGAVIGWFAALSEFFYDIEVAILSRTGEKLHGDPNSPTIQLVLVYHEEPDLQVPTDHWSTIQDKTIADNPYWTKNVHFLPFGGRVQWHSLLPQVFGHAFWILEHEEGKTLADFIGSSARGLQGDYEHHKAQGEDQYNSAANENSYGIGLIQNLTGWLPELRKGQGRMERQLKRTFAEAGTHYEEMVAKLQKICNCSVCSVINSDQAPKHGYCLPVICETIIALGLAISRMTVASGVYPTREGVQGIYGSQVSKRQEGKKLDLTNELDRQKYYGIIYANEWKANDSRRLQNAVELFTGSRPETDINDGMVAIAHEGICAYMLSFRRAESAPERSGDRGFIEVTSGGVNLRQKVFTRVSTLPTVVDGSHEALPWEEVKFKHRSRPMYCK